MRDRFLAPTVGSLLLWGGMVGIALGAAALGTSSTETLVTQMLINAIVVIGLQVFIGNTGILSFGHPAFGAYAGYVVALLTMPMSRKLLQIPDAPLGLAEVETSTVAATVLAVGLTLIVGVIVGLALVRSGATSGAVAATMITLAFLFVTHEIALNWTDLTDGGGGLGFIPRLEGRLPIIVTLLASILAARWFAESKTGRLAHATREDDVAAASVGINRIRPQMVALLLSVGIIAIGAVLRVRALGSMTPSFFYFDYTLVTLAMLIVGGRLSVTGSMLGVVAITAGTEITRVISGDDVTVPGLEWLLRPNLSDLFLGGAMLGFMLLRPKGLLEDRELDHWLRRWLPRREEQVAPPPEVANPATGDSTLRTVDLGVVFNGFRALADVSIEVEQGEIVGLIGPNGAGKTTLINAVSGLVADHEGTVVLGGEDVTDLAPDELARAGIGRTFQNLRLFRGLSVAENVAVAHMASAAQGRQVPDIDALLAAAGLWELRDRKASALDYGNQRRLELARAAAAGPDFLLLDEPTSGMGETESAEMVDFVRATAASIGAGVLVIDHDLHFIVSICDRVYVLDHGELIAAGPPHVVRQDAAVKSAYLGED
ncbi:MAG TPA: ATP-binding cassette domain-containing protein [Acidimicrobiia bacterium]|nr:ATP-binding cassette domain-containing protein [Acidimicrobiia bacterium]